MSQNPTTHDWQPSVARNGDRGWQCQRCKLTALTLTEPLKNAECKSETTETEPRNSVRAETMCHIISLFGDLTERERNIAEAAARAAYRWTLREVIEDCDSKVKAT